jgi:hypothetical protein
VCEGLVSSQMSRLNSNTCTLHLPGFGAESQSKHSDVAFFCFSLVLSRKCRAEWHSGNALHLYAADFGPNIGQNMEHPEGVILGARDAAVAEVLWHKSEGSGFETRWGV